MPKQGFESVTIPEETDKLLKDLSKHLKKSKAKVVVEAIRYFNEKIKEAASS